MPGSALFFFLLLRTLPLPRSAMFSFLPGAVVVAVGAAIAFGASAYAFGSMLRPGPGFFPLVIAVVLMLMGLGVLAEARRAVQAGQPPATGEPIAWRALIGTVAAILVFALSVERIGFVPATLLLIAICGLTERRGDWPMLGAVAVVLAVIGSVVFIWGLGLPISAFGAS